MFRPIPPSRTLVKWDWGCKHITGSSRNRKLEEVSPLMVRVHTPAYKGASPAICAKPSAILYSITANVSRRLLIVPTVGS